ncbi:metal-dependent hydrolase [Halalkalicoccus jeotgali]|uniref:Membrane-bound metal-dependent hydrolase n=1 Tax=Halalkalicoccus jeotgali (strain DSM 18796 / CECT 7217 / JCM 14584 / KCTC 4019 / B3) TaxID=795797 RepID=D8J6R2_HALJB|nr:metal-dependent hydrolase [Halalkalicoccus jeotgali]ADJ13939.1 membrane-bound metal-dependent hydrolase [Halalkalicoccus jeotgali B3]ELY34018.1 membrane-bound metal-dependent hydrolase [Halalkalicoccus jeotgali B3]
MWPWGHAAVGYLLYAAYTRVRYDRPPDGPAIILLLFGTQLPDLIDKPLAWTLPILPTGRSLGHSLLFLVPLVLVVAAVTRDWDGKWDIPLAIGAFSHIAGDIFPALIRGEFASITFLVWPLLPLPPYPEQDRSIIGHFLSLDLTSMVAFEFILGFVVVILWWRQGRPGLQTMRDGVVSAWSR